MECFSNTLLTRYDLREFVQAARWDSLTHNENCFGVDHARRTVCGVLDALRMNYNLRWLPS